MSRLMQALLAWLLIVAAPFGDTAALKNSIIICLIALSDLC